MISTLCGTHDLVRSCGTWPCGKVVCGTWPCEVLTWYGYVTKYILSLGAVYSFNIQVYFRYEMLISIYQYSNWFGMGSNTKLNWLSVTNTSNHCWTCHGIWLNAQPCNRMIHLIFCTDLIPSSYDQKYLYRCHTHCLTSPPALPCPYVIIMARVTRMHTGLPLGGTTRQYPPPRRP